jgi:hypothetical protein
MIISIVAIVAALIGILIYALGSNPKTVEIGRITFFCGLLVALWLFGGQPVHLP